MSCKKEWSRSFLQMNLPKSFIDDEYSKHIAKILWSRLESFIPSVQEKAANIRKSEYFEEKYISPLNDVMEDLRAKREEITNEMFKLESELSKRRTRRDDIRAGNSHIKRDDYNRIIQDENSGSSASVESTPKEMKFKRKCTASGCLGWLSSAWKCSLCEKFTCPDCFEIKGKKKDGSEDDFGETRDKHICKVEDVETAKMIRESTKPCPKCGYGIEKNEGCNVMFCTHCHSGFDWTSGKILEAAQIHNPHYFEWVNRGGGGDINVLPGCDTRIQATMVNRVAISQRKAFGAVINRIMHIEDFEYHKFAYHLEHDNDEDLLIEYLLKKKSKDEVKRNIQIRERRMERERDIRNILEMFVRVAKDHIIFTINNAKEVENQLKELNELREFVNNLLIKTGTLHGCRIPFFPNWDKVEHLSAIESSKLKT